MSVIDRDEIIHSLGMKLRQVGRAQIGRLLGSVASSSGRYKAAIDVLERNYLMRAELNAVTALLIAKGVCTQPEFAKQVEEEMRVYFKALAEAWPELEFTDTGYTIKDAQAFAARAKREGWPP